MLFFKGNLQSWLLEPDGNDQYSVIHAAGEKVVILQNGLVAPTLIKKREVCWSLFFLVFKFLKSSHFTVSVLFFSVVVSFCVFRKSLTC